MTSGNPEIAFLVGLMAKSGGGEALLADSDQHGWRSIPYPALLP